MCVVGFSIVELRPGYDRLALYEDLMDCLEAQDEWVQQHQPHQFETVNVNSTTDNNLSSPFIGDKNKMLVTAPWDCTEAHIEWMESPQSRSYIHKMAGHLAETDEPITLFHLQPVGGETEPPPSFSDETSFDVHRILVDPADKDIAETKYLLHKSFLHQRELDRSIWAGWRIEKQGANVEELVMFSAREKDLVTKVVDSMTAGRQAETLSFYHIA